MSEPFDASGFAPSMSRCCVRSRSGTGTTDAAAEHVRRRHLLGVLVDGRRAEEVLRPERLERARARRACPLRLCADGLPRYTPTASRPWRSRIAGRRSAMTANASSHDASRNPPDGVLDQRRAHAVGIVVQRLEADALRAQEALREHVVGIAADLHHLVPVEGHLETAGGLAERAGPVGGAHPASRKSIRDWAQCWAHCVPSTSQATGTPTPTRSPSAIGYAELRGRLDRSNTYQPVRLGDINAQTRWVLEQAGVPEPRYLPHIYLRVRDVMEENFERADVEKPVRAVGLTMAQEGLDLLPIVDARRQARRRRHRARARPPLHPRVARGLEPRRRADRDRRDRRVASRASSCHGEDHKVAGRVWVFAMDSRLGGQRDRGGRRRRHRQPRGRPAPGRRGRHRAARAAATAPSRATRSSSSPTTTARRSSPPPLDSLRRRPHDHAGRAVQGAHGRRAAHRPPRRPAHRRRRRDQGRPLRRRDRRPTTSGRSASSRARRSCGPTPRRVLLVDHAEQAQSVPGIETAEIVEILDHHHIGSIETRVPVRATFDPVGSTATLVVERFRQNGMEPSRESATVLLGAVLSDTVILNSPTTTDRDRAVVEYLEQRLDLDAQEFGREMFEAGSDVSDADRRRHRHPRRQGVRGRATGRSRSPRSRPSATTLDEREDELQGGGRARPREATTTSSTRSWSRTSSRRARGCSSPATPPPRPRRSAARRQDGVVDLPDVMSRKKQVAPVLLGAFSMSRLRPGQPARGGPAGGVPGRRRAGGVPRRAARQRDRRAVRADRHGRRGRVPGHRAPGPAVRPALHRARRRPTKGAPEQEGWLRLTGAELAKMLTDDATGLAVNPGGDLGVAIPPDAVAALKGASQERFPAGSRVRVGPARRGAAGAAAGDRPRGRPPRPGGARGAPRAHPGRGRPGPDARARPRARARAPTRPRIDRRRRAQPAGRRGGRARRRRRPTRCRASCASATSRSTARRRYSASSRPRSTHEVERRASCSRRCRTRR